MIYIHYSTLKKILQLFFTLFYNFFKKFFNFFCPCFGWILWRRRPLYLPCQFRCYFFCKTIFFTIIAQKLERVFYSQNQCSHIPEILKSSLLGALFLKITKIFSPKTKTPYQNTIGGHFFIGLLKIKLIEVTLPLALRLT